MEQLKILHCADIHIGAELRFLGEVAAKRRAETLLTFEKILETAKSQEVDLLVIAGDLFDSNHIDSVLAERVFEGLGALAPMNVVITAGNHDPLTTDSFYLNHKMPQNVHIFGEEDSFITLENIGTRVYGRSFTGSYMKGKPSFDIAPETDDLFNILVLHGDTSADLGSDYNGITQGFLSSSNMDYAALGHIHMASPLQKSGNTYYAYSGCPEGQGFDETGEKGVYIVTVKKGECTARFIPVCKRQHLVIEVDISGCDSSSQIAPLIIDQLKTIPQFESNLYKIVLIGQVDEDLKYSLEEIEERLSLELFYVKLRDKTRIKVDLETLSKENNLKGIFVRKMLEKCEQETDADKLQRLECALDIGLRAFSSEVKYREDK